MYKIIFVLKFCNTKDLRFLPVEIPYYLTNRHFAKQTVVKHQDNYVFYNNA